MINESQDLAAVSDEPSIELPASQTPPAPSINAIEPQTRRELTGELMEDGVSQEQNQTTSETTSKGQEGNLQIQSEPRSALAEKETPQVPILAINISQDQDIGLKSEASQSMDYEFIENLFSQQLQEEANTRASPKEIVIYARLPITSSQVTVATQHQGVSQLHLEDLNDVSYIIMSPTTPDKEDIIIDSESEKYNATASQLLLAHEEEIPFGSAQLSTLHTIIKTEDTGLDNDTTLCEDPTQQEEAWNFLNAIVSCPGNKRQWEPEGVDVDLMRDMIGERHNRGVTNEDCIAVIYNYTLDDDLSMPDEEYFRWCEPPTDKEELYRRYSYRLRRVHYFRRPAFYHNHKWYPEKYLPDPEDPEWSWKEDIEVDRPAQSAYQLSQGQVFWDPDRHKRNVGDHPHYKFKWHYDQINKDVPPEPLKHLVRPLAIGARFTIDKYPWSEYKPRANYTPNYHPDWKGWRVSDPVMVNLTNGRKTYMGEVRPDTTAQIFQPPVGQGWVKQYEDRERSFGSELKQSTASANIQSSPYL